jgi:hypothetical protein
MTTSSAASGAYGVNVLVPGSHHHFGTTPESSHSTMMSRSHPTPPSTPTLRPLTTHTLLGSPINSRIRSNSIGSAAVTWSSSSAHHHSLQNGSLPTLMAHHPETSTSTMNTSDLMTIPPEPSLQQKAMEAAVSAERARARQLEEQETSLSADDLRQVLKHERHRMGRLAGDLAGMKQSSVQSQLEAEVIEEGRINGIMRRLDVLQQEKGRIIVELEREEELLTNTLQKKLDQVRREKEALEKQIERERSAHVALEEQLRRVRTTSASAEQHLGAPTESLEEEDEIEMEE